MLNFLCLSAASLAHHPVGTNCVGLPLHTCTECSYSSVAVHIQKENGLGCRSDDGGQLFIINIEMLLLDKPSNLQMETFDTMQNFS